MFKDLKSVRVVSDDKWNNVPLSDVTIKYFHPEEVLPVAQINYQMSTGQIGIIDVDRKYHRNGYGKGMLDQAIQDIIKYGKAPTVWAVSSETHEFWCNVYGGAFRFQSPAHPTVWGHGFVADIKR